MHTTACRCTLHHPVDAKWVFSQSLLLNSLSLSPNTRSGLWTHSAPQLLQQLTCMMSSLHRGCKPRIKQNCAALEAQQRRPESQGSCWTHKTHNRNKKRTKQTEVSKSHCFKKTTRTELALEPQMAAATLTRAMLAQSLQLGFLMCV